MPRLKVFTTQSGFYDLAVAAPSQAAALRAWGIHQNLFADGMAKVSDDKAVIAAALAKPGVVLKRPLGAKSAFAQEVVLPKVKGGKLKAKPQPNAAARRAVAQAAEDLERAEEDHAQALQGLEHERRRLDEEVEAEREAWTARRKRLQDAGNRARRALRKVR